MDREIGLLIRRLRSAGPVRPRAHRGGGRPRLLVRGRRERPAAGERHQHRADRPGSLLRQGSRPAEGPGGRPARAHRGRAPHDRRPARTCGSRGLTRAARRSRRPPAAGRWCASRAATSAVWSRSTGPSSSAAVSDLRLWRARKFGSGAESRLFLGDPWASAYRIGPHPELIGHAVARDRVAGRGLGARGARPTRGCSGRPAPPRRVSHARDRASCAAARQARCATWRWPRTGASRPWAGASACEGQRPEYFSLVLPESSLHSGRNSVEILEVGAGGRLTSLGRF